MSRKKNNVKYIRAKLRRYFPGLAVFVKGLGLLYSRRSFLRQSGYFVSARRKMPCRRDGSPLPWMNYHIIAFLEERLSKELSLFEFGSGNSTLFFSNLVGDVTSVECDKKWYDFFKGNIPGNAKLILCNPYMPEPYLRTIADQKRKFDVVIVDAENRVDCMITAKHYLSNRGVIILDDTQTDASIAGVRDLLGNGFKKLDFYGLKPGSIRAYGTSLFYKNGNCLGI